MSVQTKAQQDLIRAEELVSQVEREPEGVRKVYGGLCHNFPVFVRTCGLCQALAFSADKSTAGEGKPSDRNRAHALLLAHVGELIGMPGGDPLAVVRAENAAQYMLHTRRVLSAWIYFKRFAVSILKVSDSRAAEDAQEGDHD